MININLKGKKERVRTNFMEFLRTGKLYKYVVVEPEEEKFSMPKVKKIKYKVCIPKEVKTFWQLEIIYKYGTVTSLQTIKQDSDYFNGETNFDVVLEWFMCSTNPYYLFRHNEGTRIFVRKEITEINVNKTTTVMKK